MSIKLRLLAEQGGGGVWPQLNFPYIKKYLKSSAFRLVERGGSGLAELFYMKKKLFWAEPLGGGGGGQGGSAKSLNFIDIFYFDGTPKYDLLKLNKLKLNKIHQKSCRDLLMPYCLVVNVACRDLLVPILFLVGSCWRLYNFLLGLLVHGSGS